VYTFIKFHDKRIPNPTAAGAPAQPLPVSRRIKDRDLSYEDFDLHLR